MYAGCENNSYMEYLMAGTANVKTVGKPSLGNLALKLVMNKPLVFKRLYPCCINGGTRKIGCGHPAHPNQ